MLADAGARFAALRHDRTPFLTTGTDEHGTKVQQAAAAAGCRPQQLCDRVSAQYRAAFSAAHVQAAQFVRTTDESHRRAVHKFWVRGWMGGLYDVEMRHALLRNSFPT